jgi:hypothetical protein
VRKEAVRKVLHEAHPELDGRGLHSVTKHICTETPKLFAILLLCDSNQIFCPNILDVINSNVTDEDLPLMRGYYSGSTELSRPGAEDLKAISSVGCVCKRLKREKKRGAGSSS